MTAGRLTRSALQVVESLSSIQDLVYVLRHDVRDLSHMRLQLLDLLSRLSTGSHVAVLFGRKE